MTGHAPDGYQDPALVRRLAEELAAQRPPRRLTFMHVCGTHENAIGRHALRDLLPDWLRVVAGPGCPVCVCPPADIDVAVRCALGGGAVLATFGDVVRVPSRLSIEQARAAGADVRVVYSPADAVRLARETPGREVVFFALGFETTACTVAAALRAGPPQNFSVVVAHRLIPPAMAHVLALPDVPLDGYVLPGHVMTVMGTREYEGFAARHGVPLSVAGFEPVDILLSLTRLVGLATRGEAALDNAYPRAVRREGNPAARAAIDAVFEPVDARWRGIGLIPASGLALRPAFRHLDAAARFGIAPDPTLRDIEPGCQCHRVMLGMIDPPECGLFGRTCTPERPVGPCMVSAEGTCRAWQRYAAGAPPAHRSGGQP